MPKIIRFHQLAARKFSGLRRLSRSQPSKGEVRIRVQASGLNRAESVYMRGRYFEQHSFPPASDTRSRAW